MQRTCSTLVRCISVTWGSCFCGFRLSLSGITFLIERKQKQSKWFSGPRQQDVHTSSASAWTLGRLSQYCYIPTTVTPKKRFVSVREHLWCLWNFQYIQVFVSPGPDVTSRWETAVVTSSSGCRQRFHRQGGWVGGRGGGWRPDGAIQASKSNSSRGAKLEFQAWSVLSK